MFEYFQKGVHGDVISNSSGQGMVQMMIPTLGNLQHPHPHWKPLTSPQRIQTVRRGCKGCNPRTSDPFLISRSAKEIYSKPPHSNWHRVWSRESQKISEMSQVKLMPYSVWEPQGWQGGVVVLVISIFIDCVLCTF